MCVEAKKVHANSAHKNGHSYVLNNISLHSRVHSVTERKPKYVHNIYVPKSTNAAGLLRMKRQAKYFCMARGQKEKLVFSYICTQLREYFACLLRVKPRIKKRTWTSALTISWIKLSYHSRHSTSCSESPQLQVIEAHRTCSPPARVHLLLIERTQYEPLSCVLFISDSIWLTLQWNCQTTCLQISAVIFINIYFIISSR